MKSAVRTFLSLLIAVGLIIALWPVGQTAYARWSQSRLQAQWQEQAAQQVQPGAVKPVAVKPGTAAKAKPTTDAVKKPVKTAVKRPKPRPWPSTRIVIPEAEVDAVVVQGMDESSLRRGPGHAPFSALPGEIGNCIISGHRNVYGSPFYKVDQLLPGSEIILSTPRGDFVYKVLLIYSVPDNDTSPYKADDPNVAQLTLITCTLPHTVERVIITAQMDPQ